MKCILNSNIANVSGKTGNILFKTYRRPDGKAETRAYLLPKRGNGKYGYERKTPPTANERAARELFKLVTTKVAAMTDEEKQTYAQQWKKANYKFNGKKYATLRGFIIAKLYNENRHERLWLRCEQMR